MAARGEQWAETGVGAVVLAAAGVFLAYALSHAGGLGGGGGGYELIARFGDVGSLTSGADVRVAGVKVGQVSSIELDPKTFLAKTHIQMQPQVKVPSDSTVKITSDGLLGGQHVVIAPGGASDDMKPGAEFQNAQGAVDLFGLIGQAIRPQSGQTDNASGGAAKPAATTAPAAADPYPGGH
jgi:phospholipid/cholesterol/gamma-HCH transport system substrate-binding protein